MAEAFWEYDIDKNSWHLMEGRKELCSVFESYINPVGLPRSGWSNRIPGGGISGSFRFREEAILACETALSLWVVFDYPVPKASLSSRCNNIHERFEGQGGCFCYVNGIARYLPPLSAPRFLKQEDAESYAAVMVMGKSP